MTSGRVLEVSKRVTGLLVTPIFTLFFLALFVRFATAAGAVLGALGGFLTALLIAFWDPLIGSRAISFTWINPCALAAGLAFGCSASLLHRACGGALHSLDTGQAAGSGNDETPEPDDRL